VSSSFDLTAPDRFTAGTVGEPGRRVFYLQAREAGLVVTLRLEKQQVAALCEYLAGILADLPAVAEPLPADLDLIEPVLEEWIVGALAVAYEEAADRILLVAEELVPLEEVDDEDDERWIAEPGPADLPDPATARFRLTRAQAQALVTHGQRLVGAGRPICRICGRPMDPDGHFCPRNN
jgi:uncharacterized repeat protein (TIGR03847 family)